MSFMGAKLSLLETFTSGNLQIVMIGLDNAGKSTILYRLKLDQYVTTMPTIGFNCEKIKSTNGNAKGTTFTVWDVGGQERIRPLWRSYIRQTNAVLFVVDSSDEERFEEAKVELSNLLRCPDLPSNAPIILFANKQDLPGSKPHTDVERLLGLKDVCAPTNRPFLTVSCCAVSGEGLDDSLDVLYDIIQKSRKCDNQHHHHKQQSHHHQFSKKKTSR